ncbi:Para-aminobenzoate synthase component 1 [Gossypium arboreum]|uniref:Para-aminobenzoate synthase component 1 n=1 Tax=Gossypium arboreum TaxID=29729 RepID=A0A0B0N416_GOSAR|nr:Para-aminobenzoate synthase component 1 [Gossypium arboreum]
MIFINNIINQILVPGNQGSFQIFMLAPLPILHRIPSSIKSRALQMLLQVNDGISKRLLKNQGVPVSTLCISAS